MKRFAELYARLDETNKTSVKVAAMRAYFAECDLDDGAWAVYFLTGRRLTRLLPSRVLRESCAGAAGLPDWMFDECYGAVGDLAETMALLLPETTTESSASLSEIIADRILPLTTLDNAARAAALGELWQDLATRERFVCNKLVTGAFRVGVSQGLVVKALAGLSGLEPAVIAHRLMGQWSPTPEFFQQLLAPDAGDTDRSRPYPFCLAHPLPDNPHGLGDVDEWLIEWKWDGIRAQLIRREGQLYFWSRGEELITGQFPELHDDAGRLPDGTVIDGEIVGWNEDRVLPFSSLQRRIGRKKVGRKLLSEVPVKFLAFDVLESKGTDCRLTPLHERRQMLARLVESSGCAGSIELSPLVRASSWDECSRLHSASREQGVEGVMLKRAASAYGVGRPTGLWWKWKVNPLTCDAVLIYAQRGHGRRAGLYTDYTFGLWDGASLVPFAKAYSGLTDAEIRDVDRFVRQHTLEKFGPVRSVKPELVFELAFENIQQSSRHKSGVAVRFPRMARWRHDKTAEQADTLESIKALLRAETS